jgi:hypothetical protein
MEQHDDRYASGGEHLDATSYGAVSLAHRALDRFPDVVRRHRFVAGGSAVSTSLIALAASAVARRMRDGATAAQAVALVTVEDLDARPLISDRQRAMPLAS